MTQRNDIKAVAIRNDHLGRADWAARVLVSLLSVVIIILGNSLSEGIATG